MTQTAESTPRPAPEAAGGAEPAAQAGPLARERRTPERFAALGVLGLMLALSARKLAEFDLPWHLATGRLVIQTGELPKVDQLAYTHEPVQYAEWLADVALYLAMQAGGPYAVQLLCAAPAAFTGWLLWRGCSFSTRIFSMKASSVPAPRAASGGPAAANTLARALVVPLVLITSNAWLIARPATFSFPLLALVAVTLERARALEADGREQRWQLVQAPLLFVVWANLHGFVVIGLVLVVGHAGYSLLCHLAGSRLPRLFPYTKSTRARHALLAAALCAVATSVNLAGPRLLVGPARATADFGAVSEWTTTTLDFLWQHEPAGLVFLVLLLVALLVGRDQGQRLPTAWDLGVLLLALALGRSAVRLIPVAAILTAPLMIRRLGGALTPLLERVPASGRERLPALGALAWLLPAPIALLFPGASLGVGFEPTHFPEPAVQWIAANQPQGKLWNFPSYGGYLSWRLYPAVRTLVDGRTGWVHDAELVRRVRASEHSPAELERLTQDLQLSWAVCRSLPDEPRCQTFAAERRWRLVFWDDISVIYVRTDGPDAPLATQGYRALNHLHPQTLVLQRAVQGKLAEPLAHDAVLAVQQDPDSPRAAFLECAAAVAGRDASAFERARARLAALEPEHPSLRAVDAAWALVAVPAATGR